MDNDLVKNIIDQFPSVAFFLGCLGAIVWLVKSLMEIKSKNYISRLNREVLNITLSSVKSQELIDNLTKLQEIVSDLEKYSKEISDRMLYVEMESLKEEIGKLVNNFPGDWKFRKELTISQDWLGKLSNINETVNTAIEGKVVKTEKEFYLIADQLSCKSISVFFAIEKLIKLTTRYKEKTESTINWVATVKSAGALCILIVFSFGLVSTSNLQKELVVSSSTIERLTYDLATARKDVKSDFMIKLNWEKPADLDLKLKLPNNEIISYRRMVARDSKARLIADIQSGPGEERILIQHPQSGMYEIEVSNYSRNGKINFEIQRVIDGRPVWQERGAVNGGPRTYRFKIE